MSKSEPSFITLVDAAFDSYLTRAPLYLGSAALIAAGGSAAMIFNHMNSNEALMLSVALLAPLHCIVAVGTSTVEKPSPSVLLTTALRKWPELMLSQVAVTFAGALAIGTLLDNNPLSILAIIPLYVLWGATSLTDVIVALDEPQPATNLLQAFFRRAQFFGASIAGAVVLGFRLANLGRTAMLAAIQMPTFFLLGLIEHQAILHKMTINVPLTAFLIACATDGLFEAIFTKVLQRLRAA